MGLLDRFTSLFRRNKPANTGRQQQSTQRSPEAKEGFFKSFLGGGRKRGQNLAGEITTSSDPLWSGESTSEFGGTRTTIPKFATGGGGAGGSLSRVAQRDLRLDDRSLSSSSIEDLLDILIDAHPDVSFALWNFLRLGRGKFTTNVYKVGSDKTDKAGEKLIRELFQRLEAPNIMQFEPSHSIHKVLNSLLLSVVTRGAGALELVLTQDLKNVAFFAPVDPGTITFKYENERYIPYQDTDRISLDIPTFLYETLDARIDDPYGRSPLIGAINMVMFQMQVLNDIKAVVHNQGYPRFDITILEDVLLQRMPINIRNNEKEKQKWLNEKLREIIDMYNDLEVDDTFVHFNSIEIGMVGGKGGGGGGSLIDPEKLMRAIDGLITAGLKTLSTILGRRSTGNTESFAKMEIKLYLKGVEAMQEVVERIMSRALTLYLNVMGKQGVVEFKFEPVEIRTELEQAQFEQIALQNWAYKRDQGWVDQDTASIGAVGTPAVAEPDWEHLGKSTVQNKDGGATSGSTDEKTPTDSSDTTK
ncbi:MULTISPECIES: hypothetical protein [unclassified Paenibacillus]|uniref:hypothetical protein n=1 Tax=unclassified Paenibacillus TaxID=185978 RepID=UPI0008977F35|nr:MULTISPECIES: hypothetical protein [unclassified Paenibacillus]OMC68661.1 hypothetical protein BK126_12600 [Paenibacillus sp. FSL H7-0326]SDW55875.1 hypothetical protein SAMN05518848_102173 [Paenibacillus sp. PDC88]